MAKATTGDLVLEKRVFHPEKCCGCLRCMMACSLRYEGVVSPLKGRTKIIKKGDVVDKLVATSECTQCGHCVNFCQYGAIVLQPVASK